MPIISSLNINRITKDEYHKIDYVMMRLAYDIHNEFGRLNNENIYKHELAERCLKHGFDVKTEVKLTVRYKEFIKHLYMDIVINDSVVYELKAVRSLVPFHQAQLLNYLMIAGMNYGKLINFGASSVEYKYVTSGLTVKDRYNFRFNIESWNAADDKIVLFENICRSLVKEWGVFLSPSIFCEALISLFGGEDKVLRPVEIKSDGMVVGLQNVNLLSFDTSFVVTAFTNGIKTYGDHLMKFLKHASLKRIQWVNFNKQEVVLKTIE